MADLKLYLTSLEPQIAQTICSQSIGGYVSTSLLYPETSIASVVGLYDQILNLDPPNEGWASWTGATYVNINDELIRVNPITNSFVSVVQRAVNGILAMHVNGDIARAVSTKELFNSVVNEEYKQYRCIAVKNESDSRDPSNERVANDVTVYLKQNSRNSNSVIRIAIEKPASQYIEGTSGVISYDSTTNLSQLVDTSISNIYADDFFNSAYLIIGSGTNNGQGRIVRDFVSATGTFIFSGALSSDTSVEYSVLPSPSQRIVSGTVAPSSNGITPFLKATERSPIRINFTTGNNASMDTGSMGANDVFYLWIERTLTKGSSSFENNDFVVNISYNATPG